VDLLLVDTASHAETVRESHGGILDRDPTPRAPADLKNDFTAHEDYWSTEIVYQNTIPAADDIYQDFTLAIDRLLDDYL
jgi:hypothetical protein